MRGFIFLPGILGEAGRQELEKEPGVESRKDTIVTCPDPGAGQQGRAVAARGSGCRTEPH